MMSASALDLSMGGELFGDLLHVRVFQSELAVSSPEPDSPPPAIGTDHQPSPMTSSGYRNQSPQTGSAASEPHFSGQAPSLPDATLPVILHTPFPTLPRSTSQAGLAAGKLSRHSVILGATNAFLTPSSPTPSAPLASADSGPYLVGELGFTLTTQFIPVNADNENGSTVTNGIPAKRDFDATNLPVDDQELKSATISLSGYPTNGTFGLSAYNPGTGVVDFWEDAKKVTVHRTFQRSWYAVRSL